MKLEQKFLLILFLIISSSILSVHSRIKYSRHLSRLSKSLHKGKDHKNNEHSDHGIPQVEEKDDEFLENLSKQKHNSYNNAFIGNDDPDTPQVEEEDDEFFENLSKQKQKTNEGKKNMSEESSGVENDEKNGKCPELATIPPPPKNQSQSFKQVLNFILGMMQQIPSFTEIGLAFQAAIDVPNQPECSSEKLIEIFHHTKITGELKENETNKAIKSYINNLGETEDVKNLDWTNPQKACKAVKKLYENKLNDLSKSAKRSGSLLESAKRAYHSTITFNEFEGKCQTFIVKYFGGRKELLAFILHVNFDGDLTKMKQVYQDQTRWNADLADLILTLEETKEASDLMKSEYLNGEDGKLDCSSLPENDEMKKEYDDFSDKFIGGLHVLAQVTTFLGIRSLLFIYFVRFDIKVILNLLKRLLGGVLLIAIELVSVFAMVGYFIYKGYRTSKEEIEKKYRFYGRAAGVVFNLISKILFK